MSKTKVHQKPDQSPVEFYERLKRSGGKPLSTLKHERINAWSTQRSWLGLMLTSAGSSTGVNATQLLEVANKVFVNHDREAPKMGDKRMKQVLLLAALLRNPSPVKQDCSPAKRGSQREINTTSRPVCLLQRDWDTGRMKAPIAEGCLKGQRSLINPAEKGTSLSQSSKILLAWPEQTQTKEVQDP